MYGGTIRLVAFALPPVLSFTIAIGSSSRIINLLSATLFSIRSPVREIDSSVDVRSPFWFRSTARDCKTILCASVVLFVSSCLIIIHVPGIVTKTTRTSYDRTKVRKYRRGLRSARYYCDVLCFTNCENRPVIDYDSIKVRDVYSTPGRDRNVTATAVKKCN